MINTSIYNYTISIIVVYIPGIPNKIKYFPVADPEFPRGMDKQRTDFVPKFSVKHFSAYTMSNRMIKILPVTKTEPIHLVHFAHREMNYDFAPPHLDILNSSDKTAPEMI